MKCPECGHELPSLSNRCAAWLSDLRDLPRRRRYRRFLASMSNEELHAYLAAEKERDEREFATAMGSFLEKAYRDLTG